MPGFLADGVFLLGLHKRIRPAEIIYPERSRIALFNSTVVFIAAYDSRSITAPVYSSVSMLSTSASSGLLALTCPSKKERLYSSPSARTMTTEFSFSVRLLA
jgi:hypothetical protein